MLISILIVLIILGVVFALIVALRPSYYRVERSTVVAAPAAEVFVPVNDLRKAAIWSPWLKMDPDVKTQFEGPPAGVGAISTWSGNNQIGEGRQTIVESRANELTRIRLDFIKPMKGTATADLTLKSEGNKTSVMWSIYGDNNFLAKAFCLFVNQDKMIGGQFEKGLADLKRLVESGSRQELSA